jgi:hypothetical protein
VLRQNKQIGRAPGKRSPVPQGVAFIAGVAVSEDLFVRNDDKSDPATATYTNTLVPLKSKAFFLKAPGDT